MPETVTLEIYVVVDKDGDYAVSRDDFDDAVGNYNAVYGETDLDYYTIEFVVVPPREKPGRTVRIEAPGAESNPSYPATGRALRIKLDE